MEIAGKLFRHGRSKKPIAGQQRRWRLLHGVIVDPVSHAVVDEVLLAVMPSPRSYTGEDVVEIQAHGGPVVLARILRLVIEQGGEAARPGEFTRRAFLNGRIDLSAAESVADMIHARSEHAAELAARLVQGSLGQRLERLYHALIDWRAGIEAAIDFPDDVDWRDSAAQLTAVLEGQWLPQIEELLESYQRWHVWRDGVTVVIIGKPNVGKSSLLNRLLGEERAIVSCQPGTTRDPVREHTILDGMAMTLIDTAGVRGGAGDVERLGIERGLSQLETADVILWVVDGSCGEDEDDRMVRRVIGERRYLKVLNKCDLMPELMNSAESLSEGAADDRWALGRLHVSALTTQGFGRLRTAIHDAVTQQGGCEAIHGESLVPTLRQKLHLHACRDALVALRALAQPPEPGLAELMAVELQTALQQIDAILGRDAEPEVLDRLFSCFCIGK